MTKEKNGKYYMNVDGEEVECLSPEEKKMMAEDFEGWLEQKKKQFEEEGSSLEDQGKVEYEELDYDTELKKRQEAMEKIREAAKKLQAHVDSGKSVVNFDWKS